LPGLRQSRLRRGTHWGVAEGDEMSDFWRGFIDGMGIMLGLALIVSGGVRKCSKSKMGATKEHDMPGVAEKRND
jgi:hypothetical protein